MFLLVENTLVQRLQTVNKMTIITVIETLFRCWCAFVVSCHILFFFVNWYFRNNENITKYKFGWRDAYMGVLCWGYLIINGAM